MISYERKLEALRDKVNKYKYIWDAFEEVECTNLQSVKDVASTTKVKASPDQKEQERMV